MKREKKKRVLVIVAHPDDETIWMGGTLLENKNYWDITIMCLCRKNDEDRYPKFLKACKVYNAKPYISDLEDESLEDISEDEVIKRIRFLFDEDYDIIFTHGENGEYGHKRHIDVNKAVYHMIKLNKLKTKKISFFSYLKQRKFCYANQSANLRRDLKEATFKYKKNLIMSIYGFQKRSFEEVCCRKIESFYVKKL